MYLSVLEAASPASGCQPVPCLVRTTSWVTDGRLLIVLSRQKGTNPPDEAPAPRPSPPRAPPPATIPHGTVGLEEGMQPGAALGRANVKKLPNRYLWNASRPRVPLPGRG